MQIVWMPPASAGYDRLPIRLQERIDDVMFLLATEGRGDLKRLQGVDEPFYRLRVGDYHVLIMRTQGADEVLIIGVARRDTAYRGLVREDVAEYTAAGVGDAAS